MNARPCKELLIKVVNDIGVLHELSRNLADRGVNILAMCGWVEGDTGYVRFITDDHTRAVDELTAKNFHVEERDAIQVTLAHRIGMMKMLTEVLARESINIHHVYATAQLADSECLVVFSCSNNEHAVVALNKAEPAGA